jgi:hypothetical protein
MLVALRRYAILGAGLSLVLVALDRLFTTWPLWPAIVLPVALVALATLASLADAPSLGDVARLADRRLDLKEQVASALEVQEGQSLMPETPLNSLLHRRAVGVLGRARREWRVGMAPARYEWLALLLLCAVVAGVTALPRAMASSSTPSVTTSTAATLPDASAPVAVALSVPDVASDTKLPVQMKSAVVSTPEPAVVPKKKHTTGAAKLTVPLTARAQAGKPQVGQKGSAAKRLAKNVGAPSGITKGDLNGVKSSAQSAQKSQPALQVRTDPHLVIPTSKSSKPTGLASQANGTSKNSSKGGSTGSSGEVTSKAVNSNSAQTRRGANGKAGLQGGVGGQGGNKIGSMAKAPNGAKMTNPYGYNPGALGTSLPKPGLISGKSSFSGKAQNGQDQAGEGAGNQDYLNFGKVNASINGKELQLISAYGASTNSSQSSRSAPGQSSSGNNGETANVKGAGGNGTSDDYVPPDANSVSAVDRSLVSSYFTPK